MNCKQEGMINVILADHERIFRIGMASALAAEDDIRIVGQPHTPEQLMRGLGNFRPHVLVLSSAFLGCMDAIKQMCASQQTAMLLLEDYGEMNLPQYCSDVQGIMRRSADKGTVVRSIRHLANGGTVQRLTRPSPLESGNDSVGMRVRDRLSEHEQNVVSYVVQGYKNREIAVRMGTTEHAIKKSLRSVFDKTGVYGRLELALFVLHHRTMIGDRAEAHRTTGLNSMAALQRFWDANRGTTVN